MTRGFFRAFSSKVDYQLVEQIQPLREKDDQGQLQTYSSRCSLYMKAAFCLPQLPFPSCSRIPCTTPAENRSGSDCQLQNRVFDNPCYQQGKSWWHWNILKLKSQTTLTYITACSAQRNVKLEETLRNPLIHCYGKDPGVWQLNLSFMSLQ